MRPALERFYQSLNDEQKARFNAIAAANDPDATAKDQRDLTKFCDEKTPSVTDLPIDRIGQAVQPTPPQRAALDALKDASIRAATEVDDNAVSCALSHGPLSHETPPRVAAFYRRARRRKPHFTGTYATT